MVGGRLHMLSSFTGMSKHHSGTKYHHPILVTKPLTKLEVTLKTDSHILSSQMRLFFYGLYGLVIFKICHKCTHNKLKKVEFIFLP